MTIADGLDVHKDKCHGVIMDEDGEILRDEKFENSLAGVQEFFKGFKHADVVMESSYSWRPTYELSLTHKFSSFSSNAPI
ncbi:hypothetical protein AKJ66_04765 [candidate division MSBL1 archaeon SCGC-AAA259E22]|uniref:Transposase IS110-like N-terminal domain-containing protein n=1 Tax=candidate division MSBL1 archaeon SCGC-AAA259E22 TaxID=1698265 RepID=A0A133UCX9_9EURY|nr:hypothetical protein AKJ66_04765 [candidate division MSBL1 archaeon SCGC-AAA259E22]